MSDDKPIVSEDGYWRWDGEQWVSNTATPPLKQKMSRKGKRLLALGITGSVVGFVVLVGAMGASGSNQTPQANKESSKPVATATPTPKPATPAPTQKPTPAPTQKPAATPAPVTATPVPNDGAAPAPAPAATPPPTPKPAPPPDTSGKATMAKFQQIENGMSLAQVNAIMGGPGELQVDDNVAGYSGQIYEWKGTGIFPGVMTVQFQNGAVIMKAQSGLN